MIVVEGFGRWNLRGSLPLIQSDAPFVLRTFPPRAGEPLGASLGHSSRAGEALGMSLGHSPRAGKPLRLVGGNGEAGDGFDDSADLMHLGAYDSADVNEVVGLDDCDDVERSCDHVNGDHLVDLA